MSWEKRKYFSTPKDTGWKKWCHWAKWIILQTPKEPFTRWRGGTVPIILLSHPTLWVNSSKAWNYSWCSISWLHLQIGVIFFLCECHKHMLYCLRVAALSLLWYFSPFCLLCQRTFFFFGLNLVCCKLM